MIRARLRAHRHATVLAALLLSPSRAVFAQAEPTAGETYKNVQVLKNVPASTFMNTMFFQRYALGVSCNYCHVGSDWDKDDKREKVTARKMLKMVLELNANQFDGRNAVNCMTCHRGAVKPEHDIAGARITLQEMLGPKPRVVMPTNAPAITAESVLTRYLTALGGADALSKVRSRVVKGNLITAEGSIVPFEDSYTASPARSLSVRHFGGTLGDFSTGFDGTNGWNSDNRGVTDQRGQALAQLVMNAEFENRLDIARLYSHWEVTGSATVNSAPAVVLTATSVRTGRTERLYFDTESGLLVRRSIVTVALFGSFTSDTYFENYRSIDGVMVPIMVSEFTPDFGTIRKFTSVENNADVNFMNFSKPAPKAPPR
jgi:hypothetical protein